MTLKARPEAGPAKELDRGQLRVFPVSEAFAQKPACKAARTMFLLVTARFLSKLASNLLGSVVGILLASR